MSVISEKASKEEFRYSDKVSALGVSRLGITKFFITNTLPSCGLYYVKNVQFFIKIFIYIIAQAKGKNNSNLYGEGEEIQKYYFFEGDKNSTKISKKFYIPHSFKTCTMRV